MNSMMEPTPSRSTSATGSFRSASLTMTGTCSFRIRRNSSVAAGGVAVVNDGHVGIIGRTGRFATAGLRKRRAMNAEAKAVAAFSADRCAPVQSSARYQNSVTASLTRSWVDQRCASRPARPKPSLASSAWAGAVVGGNVGGDGAQAGVAGRADGGVEQGRRQPLPTMFELDAEVEQPQHVRRLLRLSQQQADHLLVVLGDGRHPLVHAGGELAECEPLRSSSMGRGRINRSRRRAVLHRPTARPAPRPSWPTCRYRCDSTVPSISSTASRSPDTAGRSSMADRLCSAPPFGDGPEGRVGNGKLAREAARSGPSRNGSDRNAVIRQPRPPSVRMRRSTNPGGPRCCPVAT